ncbi:MAG: ABC transporter permease [Candidatus Omnitrophota bacterium]|nr:ABC transporter permease [Candidatus Omnitrophota bacterium]
MLLKFAIKNLTTRRRRTSASIAGISISIALLVSVLLILKIAQKSFSKPLEASGSDIIVQLQGEPCKWSLVKLPQNLNPIPAETVDKLKAMDSVASAEGSLIVWAFSTPPLQQPMSHSRMNPQEIKQNIASGKLQGEPCDYGPQGSFCETEGGNLGSGGPGNNMPQVDFSPTVVAGISPEIKDIGPINASNLNTIEGRFFSKDDTYAAILDKDFARTRYLKPGSTIDLGQRMFNVIGIIDTGHDAKIAGAQAFIPLKTAMEITGRGNIVDIVFIKLKPGRDPDSDKAAIKKIIDPNATVTTSNDFLKAVAGLSNITQALMLAIFFIAIAFSILFIIKTSLSHTLERSSEIGILKAVGWQDSSIIKMIFLENFILGSAGGLVGTFAGYLASFIYKTNLPALLPYYLNPYPPCSQHLAKNVLHAPAAFSINIFAFALLSAIAIQVFSGFFASKKLLKLMPVDAIAKL